MSFLYPYALWGLLGLSLPIIIHILSGREQSIVQFGSIRFLKPSESDAARSLGMSQYLLLLLRLLFLALICFLIAQPMLSDDREAISYWVEEGVVEDGDHQELLSSISEDAVLQCFDFSDHKNADCSIFTSGWQLIDLLNKQKDSVVVYSYSYLKYFKGNPVKINRNINWNILPRKEISSLPQHTENNGETTEWSISNEPKKTSVVYTSIKPETPDQKNRALVLSFDSKKEGPGEQLRNVIEVVGGYLKFPMSWEAEQADIQIIVSDRMKEVEPNSIYWIPSNDELKIESTINNGIIIRGKLSKDGMLRSNLPVILSAHLNKVYTSLHEHDFRVLDPRSFSQTDDFIAYAEDEVQRTKPVNSSWWLLILPMFFLERFVYFNSPTS